MTLDYANELKHYGVMGMKWGVRKQTSSSGSGKKKGLSDGQKKALKFAAATVAAGLAAYGAYRLGKSGKLGPVINAGKNLVSKAVAKKASKPDTRSDDQKRYDSLKSKKFEELSNREVSERLARQKLKEQFDRSNANPIARAGKEIVTGFLKGQGNVFLNAATGGLAAAGGKYVYDTLSKGGRKEKKKEQ